MNENEVVILGSNNHSLDNIFDSKNNIWLIPHNQFIRDVDLKLPSAHTNKNKFVILDTGVVTQLEWTP